MSTYFEGIINYSVSQKHSDAYDSKMFIKDDSYRVEVIYPDKSGYIHIFTPENTFYVYPKEKRIVSYQISKNNEAVQENSGLSYKKHFLEHAFVLKHLCNVATIITPEYENNMMHLKIYYYTKYLLNPNLCSKNLMFHSGFLPLKINSFFERNREHLYQEEKEAYEIMECSLAEELFENPIHQYRDFEVLTIEEYANIKEEESKKRHEEFKRKKEKRNQEDNIKFRPLVEIIKKHVETVPSYIEEEPRLAVLYLIELDKNIQTIIGREFLKTL